MSAITICNGVFLHTPHFLLLGCFVRQVQVFTSFRAGLKRAGELWLPVGSGAAGLVCPMGYLQWRSGAASTQPWPQSSVAGSGWPGCPVPSRSGGAGRISCEGCAPVARCRKAGCCGRGVHGGVQTWHASCRGWRGPGWSESRGDALLEHLPLSSEDRGAREPQPSRRLRILSRAARSTLRELL